MKNEFIQILGTKNNVLTKKKTPKITTATDEPKVQHVNNKSIQITLKKYYKLRQPYVFVFNIYKTLIQIKIY
jgi:hypothetical protein